MAALIFVFISKLFEKKSKDQIINNEKLVNEHTKELGRQIKESGREILDVNSKLVMQYIQQKLQEKGISEKKSEKIVCVIKEKGLILVNMG